MAETEGTIMGERLLDSEVGEVSSQPTRTSAAFEKLHNCFAAVSGR